MTTETYSDLDFKLRKVSSTGDFSKVINESAINQSLISLFNTRRGERFFNLSYGSGIADLLFEPMDRTTAESLATEIQDSIQIWEGTRIDVTELEIEMDLDNQLYNIFLAYKILNTQKTGSIELILKRI